MLLLFKEYTIPTGDPSARLPPFESFRLVKLSIDAGLLASAVFVIGVPSFLYEYIIADFL